MAKKQLLTICLRDGSAVCCFKPYNYFMHAAMIESVEKAKDDDLVPFKDGNGEEILVPKKNILFIKVMLVESNKEELEVSLWRKLD
ncbi:hypothetical protein SAMN05216413_2616 [Ruminococcaceae bacterium KH2T8]|nr:hypothetical protein SAMN05216413_2616 [Ruminococcaceae bacterium KH2T8]